MLLQWPWWLSLSLSFSGFSVCVSCVRHNKRYTSLRVVFSTLSIRSQMCTEVRLFLFLHSRALSNYSCCFEAKAFASFGCWPGVCVCVFVWMTVCGKYFSYKLPDAQYTRIFLSFSHIMTYLPHIRTRTTCKTNFATDLFVSLPFFCPLLFIFYSSCVTQYVWKWIAKNHVDYCIYVTKEYILNKIQWQWLEMCNLCESSNTFFYSIWIV